MNILAKILSHGFAVAVVALLAIGFVYRGELFPELQLPDFLSPDSETVAETETETDSGEDADASADEPATLVREEGAAPEQAEAADEAATVTSTGDTSTESEAAVAATTGEARLAVEVAGTAPVVEAVEMAPPAPPASTLAGTTVTEGEDKTDTAMADEPAPVPLPADSGAVAVPGVAVLPSVDIEEPVEEFVDEAADLAGQVMRPADSGGVAPAVPAEAVPEPLAADTAVPETTAMAEQAPAVAVAVEPAVETAAPAGTPETVAPDAGMTGARTEPASAAAVVEGAVETTAPIAGLPEAVAPDEGAAGSLAVPAAAGGQEPDSSLMQQPTGTPAAPGMPTATALPARETQTGTVTAATEAAETVAAEASRAMPAKTSPYQLLASAREAYWLHDYGKAESIYRELTMLEPDNPDWFGELGNMYFSHGKWDESASAYYEAGTRLVKAGRLDRARILVDVIRGLDGSQAHELEKMIYDADVSANQ